MSQSKKRRAWSASKKLEIVLRGMEPEVEISELCRREGISPTQYYSWKKQLVGSADAIFGQKSQGKLRDPRVDPKEQELNRLRAVIAEITAENLELKKTR
jgi:transposase